MTQEPRKDSGSAATRRGVLAGAGLVGLASALTACSSGGSPSAETLNGGATGGAATGGAGSASSASAGAAGALASTSQIPEGSGMIFASQQVVVTQPTAGEYKAFSAVCTHMGCLVNQISNGTIDCPCHGSEYSIATGAVVRGPAPLPLPVKHIKITGDSIFLE